MPPVNHVLCGLAANSALPAELVDRLITVADADTAAELAGREDLTRAQVRALVTRVPEIAVRLVHEGRLAEADIDPVAQPDAALALLGEGGGPLGGRVCSRRIRTVRAGSGWPPARVSRPTWSRHSSRTSTCRSSRRWRRTPRGR